MTDYSIVYVLVDDAGLKYYNILMKSVLSLRQYEQTIGVVVLVDGDTYGLLQAADAELFRWADVRRTPVPEELSTIERSRYLKVSVKELVPGNTLFVDSDTLFCCALPEHVSDASVAAVLESHETRTVNHNPYTIQYNRTCGIDISGVVDYFNSGVVWARDDESGRQFYQEWRQKWNETRQSGLPLDQPPMNVIAQRYLAQGKLARLDDRWNVQIASGYNTPVQYLAEAYIIHYFNIRKHPYLLCQREYYDLPYDDPRTEEIIRHPRRAFSRCRLAGIPAQDGEHETGEQLTDSHQYRLVSWLYGKHRRVFNVLERILGACLALTGKGRKKG